MIKLLKYFFQAIIVYFFFIIGKIVGLKVSRIIFSSIFKMVAPFFKSRKIIDKNLNIFASEVPNINKNQIISEMWKNYGMTFIEYIFLNTFRKNSSHIEIRGEKNLNIAISKKKPLIFVSGHFANFELMSMEITKKNIKLATIYRPLNNIFLNPFMEFLRKRFVCENQIKKGLNGVRDAIEYIRNGFSIALMIDQRVSEGVKTNFFNKPALTTTLPAQLALKYKLSIIPVFIQRRSNNKFVIEFQNEIKAEEFQDKQRLTVKLNEVLENMIVKNPMQWIWTHNRWK
ncbi:lysophospholipid acyltransferase family protein [Candidatus Pelagibacter bacterium]|nr:lysophospholipid acyltransferase family protein [Candidatus Pelagibacter bacterium]